jgi:hypothetical protein
MRCTARTQRRGVLLLAAASLACAPAPRSGDEVHIAEESAIIIWDAAAKTQHFIRRASFETKAKDFGFLVPTPTAPKLAEADDEAFAHLKRVTAPPVQRHDPERKSEMPKGIPVPAAAPTVVVIATAKVGGYDAAVLEANDAAALDSWLKQNGYYSSPALVEWYKPYIAQKWMITAFKIATDAANATRVESSAILMSFETARPLFPYREPAAQGNYSAPRMLRVYLLAEARYDGRIGGDGKWNGKAVWSNRVTETDRVSLMKELKLPEHTAPAALHLTEFEDTSSPRPGNDDLFFRTATDQSTMAKPEIDFYGRTAYDRWKEIGVIFAVLLAVSYTLFWGPGLVIGSFLLLYRWAARSRRNKTPG